MEKVDRGVEGHQKRMKSKGGHGACVSLDERVSTWVTHFHVSSEE